MKRTVLLFMFFGLSVLCCFAQEREQAIENDNALPLFSFPVFSTQTLRLGFSTLNPAQQVDLGITRYADYEPKPFSEVAKPVFQVGLMIVGLAAFFSGIGVQANQQSDAEFGLSLLLMMGGIGAYGGGLAWLILDPW